MRLQGDRTDSVKKNQGVLPGKGCDKPEKRASPSCIVAALFRPGGKPHLLLLFVVLAPRYEKSTFSPTFCFHFSAMTQPAPIFVLKSSSDSTPVSTHTRLHHRRSWRRRLLTQLVVLGLLLALVVAQSNGGTPASSPPAPQPGPDLNNQAAIAPSGESPTPTQNSGDKHHDSATATITGSASPPKPTTITTVSVINGTTTTLTLTITPTQAAQPPPPTSIPKAPQSVLVVQSISYGKVLPAAGPADDLIQSHFWDQFLPKEGGAKASDGSLSHLWRGSSESTTLVWTVMMVIVTVALLSR